MNPGPKISVEEKCYHCGDQCLDRTVTLEDKLFCCNGCKTVYEILNENQLCTYYNLDSYPGISPEQLTTSKYDYLLDNVIISQLLDFRNGNDARITFFLPQIHCASCVWLLEKLYKINDGIKSSNVNFPQKKLSVSFDLEIISLKELVIILSSIGYEPALSLADTEKKKKASHNKVLYFKIGIAGFCFGNIMLFSMPEYFDFTGDLTKNFKDYFSYINLLFALPVLFYSDLDYFKSAIGGLKKGIINLDVPLSLGMLTLFITSAIEIIGSIGPGYLDSFTGLVFFLLLGRAFQQKTFENISFERDYKSYFPLYANIIKNGNHTTLPLEKLAKGDRILVRNGDLIPADGILLKGSAYIDYSFVTGESEPVFKELGEMIYAGGKQCGTSLEIEIIKDVNNSYLTELWNNRNFKEQDKNSLKTLSDTIAKWFTVAVVFIALSAMLLWLPDYSQSVKIFAAVLIVACPCALALSIPYTFGNAIRILGRSGFYLKSTDVIESLSKSDFIVFDKTGTLTDSDDFEIEYSGDNLTEDELVLIKSLTSLSSHPLSRKLSQFVKSEVLPVKNFKEELGEGLEAEINLRNIRIGSHSYTSGHAQGGIHILIDGVYKGRYILHSRLRSASKIIIPVLSNKYGMAVCTGDTDKDSEILKALLPAECEMKFGQKPADKLDYIEELKSEGKKVIMIGDGLNDAGALKTSHVGISITDNTGHFSPASDAIMDSQSFHLFQKILDFSRYSVKTVKAGFVLSAIYNLAGIAFAVQGMLTPVVAAILMPLSSVTVVIFATAATNIKAKRLGLK